MTHNSLNLHALVADIGGTNIRFGLANMANLRINNIAVYPIHHFSSLSAAIKHYQQTHALDSLCHASIAVACPVHGDKINMTNFNWTFSIDEIKKEIGFSLLTVMNDFMAIARSLPVLNHADYVKIGDGISDIGKPMAVLGAGTGLGVAHLILIGTEYIAISGEGGHTAWAAENEQEWFIQRFLAKQYGHVSRERLLSGEGLVNIYMALAAFQQKDVKTITAAEITQLALVKQSDLATEAVNQFFACLGSYAGDLALTMGTFGGVYIAGGIVPKLIPLVEQSDFRTRFISKGRFANFNQQIATYIIKIEQPGLVGAAAYLKQLLGGR